MVVLSSSGGVESNFGVAQGTAEVGPCSQNQMGTFLEHGRQTEKKEMQLQGQRRLQSVSSYAANTHTKKKK